MCCVDNRHPILQQLGIERPGHQKSGWKDRSLASHQKASGHQKSEWIQRKPQ